MGAGLIITAWMLWQRRLAVWVGIPIAAVLAVGIFLAGSRGPTIGCALGIVILAFFSQRQRARRAVFVVGAFVVGIFGLSQIDAVSATRLGEFIAHPMKDVDGSLRENVLARTFTVIIENPGGVGYGNWQSSTGSYLRWPHNLFLELIAEGGWAIGGILIATVLFVGVRLVRRARRSPEVSLALALLLAETFAVCVSGDLNARSFFAFLTLGFVVGSWDSDRDLHPADDPPRERHGAGRKDKKDLAPPLARRPRLRRQVQAVAVTKGSQL